MSVGVERAPPAGFGGAIVFVVSGWWSVCRGEFGRGGAGAGFVHDGFAVGVGGEEGMDGQVVDRSRVAAAGVVDEGDRVVGEQGIASADELEVVADVAGGLGCGEAAHGVAHGDALVEGGEDPELHFPFECWLSNEDAGEWVLAATHQGHEEALRRH